VRNTRAKLAILAIAPTVFVVSFAAPAAAQAYHNSQMSHPYCLSVPYVPGDCTGFIVGNGVTVQMNCWDTGPSALGSAKWFDITVLSGKGYGATGDVPANAVKDQWLSSPRCP
jgi:hypothetical protein